VYLLDSDILSLLHQGNERIRQQVEQCDESEIATTIVSHVEILRARIEFLLKASDAQQLLVAQYWFHSSVEFLNRLRTVPFDAAAAAQFEKLRGEKRLRKIGKADLLIASIVIANSATLVTRNMRDFKPIRNLRTVNWAQ
jgi:tRNA(fMet)-specific endonuclease VapC